MPKKTLIYPAPAVKGFHHDYMHYVLIVYVLIVDKVAQALQAQSDQGPVLSILLYNRWHFVQS